MKLHRSTLGILGSIVLAVGVSGGLTGCDKSEPASTSASTTAPSSSPGTGTRLGGAAQPLPTEAGTTAPTPAPDSTGKSYTFGVIAKANSNPVFLAARTGAEEAARDLSKKYGVEVKIQWRTPNSEDAQFQAQTVEQLTAESVNGIAVSCTNADILTPAIDNAVSKGVEVVTFDSDAPNSKRFAYYGIDDVAAGAAVMEELAKAMGDKGVVAILAGNQSAPNLQSRVKGVRDEAARHPGITIKETYYHKETPQEAVAKLNEVQTANPDITGWAMVGGWPLFTANALDSIYQSAKVTSVDHLPAQLDYVRNGQVQCLIGQDCYGWGYRSVELLFDKVHNKKSPEQAINNFPLSRVTKDNVEEFSGLWDKWLAKTE